MSPNILLVILFLNGLCHISLLIIGDHALQPYSTTGNVIVLYILILKFLEVEKIKVFELNNNMNFPLSVYILFPGEQYSHLLRKVLKI